MLLTNLWKKFDGCYPAELQMEHRLDQNLMTTLMTMTKMVMTNMMMTKTLMKKMDTRCYPDELQIEHWFDQNLIPLMELSGWKER